MKIIASVLAYSLLTLLTLLVPPTVSAQTNQTAEWMRVGSDDGEFSIEVPARYAFIVDKDGFSVARNSDDYALQEMKMLNAYSEKTLLSFEVYKASKNALDIIREKDEGKNAKSSEIRRDGFRIKQIVLVGEKSYVVRQYFSSKNRIYILTAGSRSGETAAMGRFLNSLIFRSPDSKQPSVDSGVKTTALSALKVSQIEIEEMLEPLKKLNGAAVQKPPATKDENALPLAVLIRPRPSYTDAARRNGVTGTIQMRLTFTDEAHIAKVQVLKILGQGLNRQAFFAALRLKFLPAEKDGKPRTVSRIIEYDFDIY